MYGNPENYSTVVVEGVQAPESEDPMIVVEMALEKGVEEKLFGDQDWVQALELPQYSEYYSTWSMAFSVQFGAFK